MTKYDHAPHPFIIEPPLDCRQAFKRGDEITFGLTLVGRAIDYLPYFIYAFDELGKLGIGKGRGKYELKYVGARCDAPGAGRAAQPLAARSVIPAKAGIQEVIDCETIYDSGTKTVTSSSPNSIELGFDTSTPPATTLKQLSMTFLTPTRINYRGSLTLDLEFHILIRNLLRRISLLSYFHCGEDPADVDFKGLIHLAEGVEVKERNLQWYDWERYSARQDTRMKMGGFTGSVTFSGNIGPFLSLLKAGEVLHVGKGTSFGLGKYILA
ncbi:MAG: CRISPR system precrRNA processing endoribonuclease RAMP protein Cas6 [Nitrospiraceae bacterium]|nr:CRISPR system precrRNA processing endoribonuclease RAMP protein Cas6 [Nitrospiraceae bacterium]